MEVFKLMTFHQMQNLAMEIVIWVLQKVRSFYEDLMEVSDMLPLTQKKETIEILKKSHEDTAENLTAMIKKLNAG